MDLKVECCSVLFCLFDLIHILCMYFLSVQLDTYILYMRLCSVCVCVCLIIDENTTVEESVMMQWGILFVRRKARGEGGMNKTGFTTYITHFMHHTGVGLNQVYLSYLFVHN